MRISILLLTVGILSLSASGYSQDAKVSIQLQNKSVNDVLSAIKAQTSYSFWFDVKDVNVEQSISLDATNETVKSVLSQTLKGQDVDFAMYGNHIIIAKKGTFNGLTASQQGITITGMVTDQYGEPMPGVNILERGTLNGSISDTNGRYTINIPNNEAALVFSFIGYKSQEFTVGAQRQINVVMEEDTQEIEEVVVVGYGVKKKANLTGATSTVSAASLTNRTAPNTTNLLQGKVAGLQITQSSGQPGKDNSSLRIRGLGTFSDAGSDPMVLIDGVQGNLSNLNSQDIESVTVLKDAASAAIYGARAANGVILISTKQGKSGLNIEYNGNVQFQQATRVRDLVTNSADFMSAFNVARERSGQSLIFTDEEISNFRNGNDPIKYPNFDWRKHMLKTGLMQNHHLSFNGGDEKTKFNFSVGYLDQGGIVDGFDFQKINGMLNISSKLSKIFTVGANINLRYQDIDQPVAGNGNAGEMFFLIYVAAPNFRPKLSDSSGRWARTYKQTQSANRNPEAVLEYGNRNDKNYSMMSQAYLDVNFTKDLVWSTKFAINYDDNFFKSNEKVVAQYNYNDNSSNLPSSPYTLGLQNQTNKNILMTVFSTLTYNKAFAGKHNVNAMVGFSQEQNNYRYLNGYRPKMPFDILTEINSGSADGQTLSGNFQQWAIQSFFGRLSYDYLGKYLFEANARYDGTSRIISDNRWGLFPSFSAGWRISEESFMKNLTFLDVLKIRGSWGQLGNQNIGLYPYQDLYSTGLLYPFGTTAESGVAVTRMTDKNLHWEKTSVLDFGFDLSVNRGIFSLTFDWFHKVTDGILSSIDIPASIGLSAPVTNFASMRNNGIEFELGHQYQVGDFSYSVSANLATFRNKVLKVVAPQYGITTVQEGLPYRSYYLTEWTGIFQSQDEIDSGPVHQNNPKPGDLKFKNQNDDNKIDGNDRIVMDGAFPKFYYGGSIDLFWKGFDLNLFFQGVQGQKHYISGGGIEPFNQGGAPTKEFFNNCWTPENKTNKYPGMYTSGYGAISGTPSSYFLSDASYFKLKSFMLGFNLSTQTCKKIGLKNIRIYFSGDNVFMITKYPYPDPDRLLDGNNSGNIFVYPQIRSFSIGLNIKY